VKTFADSETKGIDGSETRSGTVPKRVSEVCVSLATDS